MQNYPLGKNRRKRGSHSRDGRFSRKEGEDITTTKKSKRKGFALIGVVLLIILTMSAVGSFSLIETRQNKLNFFSQIPNSVARKNLKELRALEPQPEEDMFASPTLENEIYEEIVSRSNFFENEKIFVSFFALNVDGMLEKFGEKAPPSRAKFLRKTMDYIAPHNARDSWILIPSIPATFPFFDIYMGNDEETAEKIWNKLGLGLFPKTIFQEF